MPDQDQSIKGSLAANAQQAERLHRFAHDLKNRLAGLHQALGFVMGDDPAHDELRAFAERQFFDALRNVEELMDDMGVDRGPGTIGREPVDLAAMLRSALKDQAYRFEAKQQSVQIDAPNHLEVVGDAHLLRDLAGALLSNAAKFSHNGAPVHVSLKIEKDRAVLTVTDQGVGLSKDDLANVFKRYAMLGSRSTAKEAQGRSTLSRALQWAQAHGGTLTAQSKGEGCGCTFTLALPMH